MSQTPRSRSRSRDRDRDRDNDLFSTPNAGVGSSPIWTLTNVGIKFLVTEEILFSLKP